MKKLVFTLALACHIATASAAWTPLPNCIDGKWQINSKYWTITQTASCSSDKDIQPGTIFGDYTNPHGGAPFIMIIKFYDAKGELAVIMQSHAYTPWGKLWTGNKRSKKAYCPSETGKTTIDHCPIIIPG